MRVFFGILKTPKSHSKINCPLLATELVRREPLEPGKINMGKVSKESFGGFKTTTVPKHWMLSVFN